MITSYRSIEHNEEFTHKGLRFKKNNPVFARISECEDGYSYWFKDFDKVLTIDN